MTEHQMVDPSVTAHLAVCQQSGTMVIAQDKTIIVNFGDSHLSFPVHEDVGTIRALDFLQNANGLFAIGGDNKFIAVYDVSSGKEAVKIASYGPHAKRITAILSIDSTNAFTFSDKFGETYMLRFKDPKNPKEGLMDPVFLMQHMSVLTKVIITKPALPTGRRIVTADRDCHVRVSRFPNAFDIDAFLWRDSPQTIVCALAEMQGVSGGANKDTKILVAAGSANGLVAAYSIDNDGNEQNIIVGEKNIRLDDTTEDTAVIALAEARSANGQQSVLIAAADCATEIAYYPVSKEGTIDPASVKKCSAPSAIVTTAVAGNGRDVFALLRCSTIGHFVLGDDGVLNFVPITTGFTQKECSEQFGAVLKESDFNAIWKSMALDAKTRKAADEDDDIPQEGDKEGDKPKKKSAKKEKK